MTKKKATYSLSHTSLDLLTAHSKQTGLRKSTIVDRLIAVHLHDGVYFKTHTDPDETYYREAIVYSLFEALDEGIVDTSDDHHPYYITYGVYAKGKGKWSTPVQSWAEPCDTAHEAHRVAAAWVADEEPEEHLKD